MKTKRRKMLFFIPVMIGIIFGLGALVMVLWNSIFPELLGVNSITYWQSMGLLILCKILFGGFGPGKCGPRADFRRRAMMRRRMANLSMEDREKFKEEFKKRCS